MPLFVKFAQMAAPASSFMESVPLFISVVETSAVSSITKVAPDSIVKLFAALILLLLPVAEVGIVHLPEAITRV